MLRAMEKKYFLRRMLPRRRLARWLVVLLTPMVALGLWVAYLLSTNNFHPIVEGEAYRSGQMSSNELARYVERYGIRSVINLRGPNPEREWYREELEATQSLGLVHENFRMSSRSYVSARRADHLVEIFKAVPKPVLIHCDGGADRAAFAAALYAAEVAKLPLEVAEGQFSPWYGHLPFILKRKARLRESFRAYTGDGS
jgi:protein tyrosine/serine phosphatase